MQIKTFIINAFTNKAFAGNPAGVCLITESIGMEIMQSIASELNLSETAFISKIEDRSNQYDIRYFTPTVEIDFCGHATLAASKLVLDKLGEKEVEFITQKQLRILAVNEGEFIKMVFPLYETTEHKAETGLFETFGIANPISTRYSKTLDMVIVEVKDKETLLGLSPNYQKAIEISDTIKEVVVTTKSADEKYDFYSRCFAPWLGINEDPVTGASHSVLAKYWGDKLEKKEMAAYQLSKRGGFLNLKIINQNNLEVRSNAQIVFEGIMNI